MSYLKLDKVTKSFGGVKALDNVSFEVKKGEVIGLIGPNGSGKSTLFNAMTSIFPVDSGSIVLDDINTTNKPTHEVARMGVSRTFQDAKPLPQISVADNLDLAFNYPTSINLFNALFRSKRLKEERAANLKHLREMLKEVGIPEKETVLAQDLSYGQGKLLEVLKVMAFDGKLVLLDEPFSGLFPEMIKLITKLIRRLADEGKTIMLVEHNMKLISEICDRVVVLDAGRVIADGKFGKVKNEKIVIESYLGG
jgi:ABC-type branched-subunit amino acid transport system ATPase component